MVPLYTIVLGAALAGMPQTTDDLARLLPPEVNGWQPAGRDARYGADTLSEYIDGGAELYISYGVRRVVSRRYAKPGDARSTVTVDVFDMAQPANAFGLFSHSRENPTGEVGQGSEYGGGLLFFWKGRYYVSILGYPESPETRDTVMRLGRAIAAAIPETGRVPAIVSRLPPEGLQPNSVRYFRHHAWINSHGFVSDENLLHIEPDCEAVLARYRQAGRSWVLLVVVYPDETRSRLAAAEFTKVYLKGAADGVARFPDGKWAGCQREGTRVLAALHAPSAEVVRGALRAATAAPRK